MRLLKAKGTGVETNEVVDVLTTKIPGLARFVDEAVLGTRSKGFKQCSYTTEYTAQASFGVCVQNCSSNFDMRYGTCC